ncbi:MAG: CHAD domain-containing protein, partial [Candidatus Aegiribacteria sp.]|nr:CHAD domain-containing protein [Candidatus Aegiribacteria sp.]MBD3294455.1 CHAD domain-containing protein [Candidatus Fermentibacteria bacterium]
MTGSNIGWKFNLTRFVGDICQRLSRQIMLLGTDEDPEVLHQVRKDSRRLRLDIRLMAGIFPEQEKGWRRLLRNLRDSLSLARDTDVQIIHFQKLMEESEDYSEEGLKVLIELLKLRRRNCREGIEESISGFRSNGFLEELPRILERTLKMDRQGKLK